MYISAVNFALQMSFVACCDAFQLQLEVELNGFIKIHFGQSEKHSGT